MLIILRSLIIGILVCCDLVINTDITRTRKVIYFFPGHISLLILVKRKQQLYIVFIFLNFLNWWMIFFLSAEGYWNAVCRKKLHLAPSSSASVEITDWRRDPSRLVKERGPQSFTWMSTPAPKYHCSAIYLDQGSLCNLSPCRFALPFFILASLICYEFNQVYKFVMHVKLNMQWHIRMWLPYQPPRSSFSIM